MNDQGDYSWVYGWHTVEALFKYSLESVHCVYVQQTLGGRQNKKIDYLLQNSRNRKIKVVTQNKQWLDQKSQGGNHQGIMVQCQLLKGLSEQELGRFINNLSHPPLVLVLDKIQDPHNLGACFRNADALGVDLIIFPKSRSVGITSIVHKIASGATFVVPFLQAVNLSRVIKELQQQGLWLVATTLVPGALQLNELDLKVPTGIVLGAEGEGISKKIAEQCDYQAYIEMLGSVQS